MFGNVTVALFAVLVCIVVPLSLTLPVSTLEDQDSEAGIELVNTTQELQELKRENLQGEQYDIRTQAVREVGFTAELSTSLLNLPIGHTVVYTNVASNEGNGYDSNTGIFTCPTAGLYMFGIFVHAMNKKTAIIHILVEGTPKAAAVSEPREIGEDDTGGNMYVGHLTVGQRVWVETYSLNDQDLFHGFTTFSGALLQSAT